MTKIKAIKRSIYIMLCVVSVAATFSQSLTFDSNLFLGSNNGMQDKYSNIYFQYGGNQFPGVIFRKQPQTIAPTNIILGSQTIAGCTQKIQGAYYNPARGNRVRPLDQDTLDQRMITENLLSTELSYYQLTLTGGLYTNCAGNSNAIYGHIQHTRSGNTVFHLIAGTQLNFTNNSYNNTFDTSLQISSTLNANGFIFDTVGGIGEIGALPVCGNGIIEVGELCDDTNTIAGDGCSNLCQVESGWICTGEPSTCVQTPPPVTDRGNAGFNARLQFPSLYTNTPYVYGLIYMTEPVGYTIQGDTNSTFAGTLNQTAYTDIVLTSNQGTKTLITTFTSLASGIVLTGSTQIILDFTAPTLNIIAPTSGAVIIGALNVSWLAQDANGIAETWIQIHQGNNLVYSNTSVLNNHSISTLANGSYTMTITVYDAAGNMTTQSVPFTLGGSTIPSNRSLTGFTHITGANIDTMYTSSPIIVAGLPTGTSVTGTINTGTLIKNSLDVGTSASFTNGDTIKIALRSAISYNTTQTAQLSINNTIIPFYVTTKVSADNNTGQVGYCLSTNQYALIFLGMKNLYGDNETKFREVLQLMLMMINDLTIILANEGGGNAIYALDCFADIVQNYLLTVNTGPNNGTNQWIYTAPNGKQYTVQYLTDIDGYTSPDFMYPKIFVSYETFTAHIDLNNPKLNGRNHIIDPSFTPVVHTAPSGKSYTIQKTNKGFMSYQFVVPAYFQTLEGTKAHINRHNPQ